MPQQSRAQEFLSLKADEIARDVTGNYGAWPALGAAGRVVTDRINRYGPNEWLQIIMGTAKFNFRWSEALSPKALEGVHGKELIHDLAYDVLVFEVECAFEFALTQKGIPMPDQPDLPHSMVPSGALTTPAPSPSTTVYFRKLPTLRRATEVLEVIRRIVGVTHVDVVSGDFAEFRLSVGHEPSLDLAAHILEALPVIQLELLEGEDAQALWFGYDPTLDGLAAWGTELGLDRETELR